jgi:hypothetical protein
MGTVCQFRKASSEDKQGEPLNNLAELISQAEADEWYLAPAEVQKLAAAAKKSVESLLSDMERVDREALQDAVLEVFQAKGNA